MHQAWLFPVSLAIGAAGTRTAVRARHGATGRPRDASWALMLFLGWLPLFCWILSQVVGQY